MIFTYDTVFQTRGTYKIPGGVGLPVVKNSVDAPVVYGNEVGVAVDDDPVEGVSRVGYGVADESIEASAVVRESPVTRFSIKRSINNRGKLIYCKEYFLLSTEIWVEYQMFANTSFSQDMPRHRNHSSLDTVN